ncbi:hypothetical protein HID58_029836 [Brassica napus]|uniref:DUF6857 domain-containing protein n=1 Tax=Brassica napus TaxID=3708 RepID=A0ABQ8CE92_BRANA|nr:hypothetical protein HID58_029836 [Brassica napus]
MLKKVLENITSNSSKKKHENNVAQDVIVQDTIVLATTLEFDAFEVGAKKNAVAWVQDAKLNPKENTTSPRNQAYKGVKQPSTKHSSVSEISKNRLKESLSLAEKLSYSEFQANGSFKYLENSLKKGSFFVKKEEANGKYLKAVNCWLDDLIKNRCEASEKVKELRKKLHQFLLKHIESATGETM